MKLSVSNFFAAGAVSALVILSARADTTNLFGFSGKEVYPIDQGIGSMHVADIDGDGLNDIVVVNNLRAKINILYNLTGKTNLPAVTAHKLEVNELPPDSRFRIDSIPTDEYIRAFAVADVNGDGKPDLIYFGDSKDLEVIYNQGTNGWSVPKKWHLEDGQESPNALAIGDLNGDGLDDIAYLGDNTVYYLAQKPDHTLAEPVKISFSGAPKAIQIVDVDGDGKSDLLLVDFESSTPYRVRQQITGGQLGPEIFFKSQPIRSFTADALAGDKTNYIVSIVTSTGRAEVGQVTRKAAEALSGDFTKGQFQIMPLSKTDAATRGVLWADVDGDGRADLLVAEPESGQISIYLQQADGTLAPAKKFPSLAGVSQIAVGDWNGDGHPEIFLLSRDENAIGMTSFDKNGRLPFPTLLQFDGKPIAMTVGALKPGAKPTLAVIVDKDGGRTLVTKTGDGKSKTQKLSDSFKSNPTQLAIADANQDGLNDLLVLIPYEKIKVLLQTTNGGFDEKDVDPPGGAMEQPWFATLDADGDGKQELLLPQKNFVRAVVLEQKPKDPNSTNSADWTFRVKDQINGASSDSHISGAAVVPNGKNATPSLFLLDDQNKQLTLCERDTNGVWQVVKNIELPVVNFPALSTVTLGGKPAVAFTGHNSVAWQSLAGDVWDLTKLDDYDTPIKDGYLNDLIAGDLLGNKRKQLVFMETAKNYIDLVVFDKNRKLVPGDRWQVFEQHTFRAAQSAVPEPGECAVGDVTGDGKNDLLVLVHDRILVYPQE
jgi:hypothetical protein